MSNNKRTADAAALPPLAPARRAPVHCNDEVILQQLAAEAVTAAAEEARALELEAIADAGTPRTIPQLRVAMIEARERIQGDLRAWERDVTADDAERQEVRKARGLLLASAPAERVKLRVEAKEATDVLAYQARFDAIVAHMRHLYFMLSASPTSR
jgi:hypothetical protein